MNNVVASLGSRPLPDGRGSYGTHAGVSSPPRYCIPAAPRTLLEPPMPALPADVRRQLEWRYATKKFDPARRIPADTWDVLEDALVLAPSSYGLQPWRFVVVTDPAVKDQLVAHSWGQRQVADCSHLVVFALKLGMNPADADRLIARTAEVRHAPPDALAGYRDMMAKSLSGKPQAEIDAWMRCQVYLALGQFLAAAAMVGVDACPMEGFVPAGYDQVLGLAGRGYTAAVIAPAGYRSADDATATKPKVRFPKAEVVERVGG